MGNMGWRYLAYRASYEAKRRSGILKKNFPTGVASHGFISLKDWQNSTAKFFFAGKEDLTLKTSPNDKLEDWYKNYQFGDLEFFNSQKFSIGIRYNWLTNPTNGYQYPLKHWCDIPDFSSESGDIKFVWEKSRFSFVYYLIRHDYHFKQDHSGQVLKEILSWIDANPVNEGPNYRCSQEISLRVLNWTFALHYYKFSHNLTAKFWNKIINSIYWQIKHVRSNINFSRIAVRNNHAITECLSLYLVGLLYPFFPESAEWKKKGKKWFEEEVAYQVYPDGTYLQFSMNYHRVVIQLLTWAIRLAELNGERFGEIVYSRAKKSLEFLYSCTQEESGYLPNYGANDGALFFPLNNKDYRDFRPQLKALATILGLVGIDAESEDQYWYGNEPAIIKNSLLQEQGCKSYTVGGYFVLREQRSFTFIRCGNHKDRPSHADNLHLDLWVNGENVLLDSGTYKYNANPQLVNFFSGTSSHNTVMLGSNDQMKKGGRFIWYYWTQCISGEWIEHDTFYMFRGAIKAFTYLGKNIVHTRQVKKYKGQLVWEIHDKLEHNLDLPMNQIWNMPSVQNVSLSINAVDGKGGTIPPEEKQGWRSLYYGKKEPSRQTIFSALGKEISTTITVNLT